MDGQRELYKIYYRQEIGVYIDSTISCTEGSILPLLQSDKSALCSQYYNPGQKGLCNHYDNHIQSVVDSQYYNHIHWGLFGQYYGHIQMVINS
jgi:hypothetical protein